MIYRAKLKDATVPLHMMKYYQKKQDKNYQNPPIPNGFSFVKGKWNSGYTIQNDSDGSLFLWIPVGAMPQNSTEDGVIFNKKFGRNEFPCENDVGYKMDCFFDDAVIAYKRIIEQTGGFYISCFIASWKKNSIIFTKGNEPMITDSHKIEKICNNYAKNLDGVKSMAVSGASYDCMVKYLMLQTNENEDLFENSRKWNAYNSKKTGENTGFYGIYDLGMFGEFTTEINTNFYVVRGEMKSIASRTVKNWRKPIRNAFRVVLYVDSVLDSFEKGFQSMTRKIENYETCTKKKNIA